MKPAPRDDDGPRAYLVRSPEDQPQASQRDRRSPDPKPAPKPKPSEPLPF